MFESIKFYIGEELNYNLLPEELCRIGYRRTRNVLEAGDFALRGEVIDIFPFMFESPIRLVLDGRKIESIKSYNVPTGSAFMEHTAVIVLPFRKGPFKGKARFAMSEETVPIDNFVDMEEGDYVVHVEHGIGVFRGFEKLPTKEGDEDNIVIEYARGDRLYVPIKDMGLIQRYIGFESRKRPRLCRLGSGEWRRIKSRARKGVYKIAFDLLELQAKREAAKGFSFSKDADWQKELEASFPFRETPDQLRASCDVKRDMESGRPMDRLLMGDVGYGKTEVALRAAFKCVMDNRQCAILVPTTILAEQHYDTFSKRMKDYPVNIAMLSRFRTHREQDEIIKSLKAGRIDIVIGTHRLLSDDIGFRNLGLVIIDEEQRFGVKDKEKLKAMRLKVDILTLTATPIPRTLYISVMGAKDMSLIETPPEERLPVRTYVGAYDEDLTRMAIEFELSRDGQVYFIHNRVMDIAKMARRVTSLAPKGSTVGMAHGQMPPRALEKVILKFINGRIDILVSTNIVESGIDIPKANTLIINRADTFGLSDLYQLRGRVGRFSIPARAYLFIPKKAALTSEAQRRLQTIARYTELGSGFKIAMRDLEIRGAGNLLGVEQHGYIEAVGFDLYCRLLREAVAALKSSKH